MQKLKNIEFIRTFLITTIILLHTFLNRGWCLCSQYADINIYKLFQKAFVHSNNSVEGFFIIAGFLLILTFKKSASYPDFIKKKYIRLSPVIAFSILFFIIGNIFNIVSFKPVPDVLSIALLNNFGIRWAISDNPVLWFTSALFGGLLIYFCIYKYLKKYAPLIISFLSIAGYLVLEILQGGNFSHPLNNYYGIFNVGFLRAVGGIGLGCLLGIIYKKYSDQINDFKADKLSKIFISFAEVLSFLFLLWWTIIPHSSLNNLYFVIAFTILFSLMVIKKGYFSNLTEKDIWVKLAKYQYSLYVTHYVIIKLFGLALWKNTHEFIHTHPILPIFTTLFAVLCMGIFTYHFIETPCADWLKNKLMNKTKAA